MNVAVYPESGFVEVSPSTFARDHQYPYGTVFIASAQLSQFKHIGSCSRKILKKLRQFGVLVKAIKFWMRKLGCGGHGGVQ